MAKERVQKILARAGISSRRKAEELIREGAVTINGKVAKLGDQAEYGTDSVKVKGKLLHSKEAPVYIAFYKPRGVISMFVDPDNRPNLSDYLGEIHSRLFPIGRMDFTSEGLLLLTNDGDFAEKIQRNDEIIRVYNVKVKGHISAEMIKRLERGAKVGTRLIKPQSVKLVQEFTSKAQVEVVIVGSGAVDVKAFFEIKGFLVERIIRTALGHIRLAGLKPGTYRQLKDTQAQALLTQPELGLKRYEFELQKLRLPAVRDSVPLLSKSAKEEQRELEKAKLPAPKSRRVIVAGPAGNREPHTGMRPNAPIPKATRDPNTGEFVTPRAEFAKKRPALRSESRRSESGRNDFKKEFSAGLKKEGRSPRAEGAPKSYDRAPRENRSPRSDFSPKRSFAPRADGRSVPSARPSAHPSREGGRDENRRSVGGGFAATRTSNRDGFKSSGPRGVIRKK